MFTNYKHLESSFQWKPTSLPLCFSSSASLLMPLCPGRHLFRLGARLIPMRIAMFFARSSSRFRTSKSIRTHDPSWNPLLGEVPGEVIHYTLWKTYKELLNIAIYSGFSGSKWWFSIIMLVYQRVNRMGWSIPQLQDFVHRGEVGKANPPLNFDKS